jgi:hypothetical protein
MRLPLPILGLTLTFACGKSASSACDELCADLVTTCQIPAYPTIESCLAGCAYNAEQGADIEGELACIDAAACNEFAIVECEHKYGVE